MNYQSNKYKLCVTILFAFFVTLATSQINKDDISIVQFSAKFVSANELSLSVYAKDYNTQTLYISEHKELFDKEKIKYLPTLILYNEGERVLVITSDLSLKLPKDAVEQLDEEINNILKTKF
jgi:hypothetical protein|tara:strand:+ start:976 stop:1341 length:366 start_codon:yes stop_codon:yes gene_type:complete